MARKFVDEILSRISAIHKKKNHDYAQENNPWSNFERAAVIASWFNDPVDKVFATMIGIKLARKAELLNGKTPNNESLEDTFLDENTYSVLWHGYYLDKENKPSSPQVLHNQKAEESQRVFSHEAIRAAEFLHKHGLAVTDIINDR